MEFLRDIVMGIWVMYMCILLFHDTFFGICVPSEDNIRRERQFNKLYDIVSQLSNSQLTKHACYLFHPPMPLPIYQLYDSSYSLNHINNTWPLSGGLEFLSVVITAVHTAHYMPWTQLIERHPISLKSCHRACISPKL